MRVGDIHVAEIKTSDVEGGVGIVSSFVGGKGQDFGSKERRVGDGFG